MFPIAHKTVFVIDESPSFVTVSSQEPVDFDSVAKSRQLPSNIPPMLPPIAKSLWSCAIEAIVEYCRIVWDVYPEGQRVINFARCRPNCPPILSWSDEDQTLPSLMKSFIGFSKDVNERAHNKNNDSDLIVGLTSAISILATPTSIQKSIKESVINRGRIVVISWFRNDAQIMAIQDQISAIIEEWNSKVRESNEKNFLSIDTLDLTFVNSQPINTNGKITEKPNHSISSRLSVEVHSTKSGTFLANKLISLVLKHYDLASTTVTGIPMKEEQNASTSANYDVEIVHPKEVHVDIYRSGLADVIKLPKEGCEYFSIPLKWCTPRTSSAELHYSTSACRLTTVDVCSRPSSCLTNFLLAGRMVMLEMPARGKSARYMSHMLSAHSNELYIHALASSRTILEDPPSISEGTGGRVTDYRITDFAEVIKKNKITLCSPSPPPHPYQRAQEFLARFTNYWPMVIGNTILFNIQMQIQPLLELMPKESLTPEDVGNCKQSIYGLVTMESRGIPLPTPGLTTKGKGAIKKDEMYRLLFRELNHYLSNFSTTNEHRQVITLLNELTNTGTQEEKKTTVQTTIKSETSSNGNQASFSHFTPETMSPDESPTDEHSSSKKARTLFEPILGPQESLLSFWTKRLVNDAKQKHAEFDGRKNGSSNITPLYVHLLNDKNNGATEQESSSTTT